MYKFKFSEYLYPVKLDWPTIITDMLNTELSQADIANLVGAPWSTIASWRDGVEPREAYGRSLLALHCRSCGVDLTIQRITEAGGMKQIEYLIEIFKKVEQSRS